MDITRAYRFRLYPTPQQEQALLLQFGAIRFTFNHFLARRIALYQEAGKGLPYRQTSAELTALKRDPRYAWLLEANAVALQKSLRDLDKAFQNFFRKRAGFPNFKRKHGKQSFRLTNQALRLEEDRHQVILPKIGPVRMVNHCPVSGRILSATCSRTKSGKYFLSVTVEQEIQPLAKPEREVGIDVGLKSFLVTSEGEKVEAPRYLRKSERRLKRLQRRLSRKQKGSTNRGKARVKLARLHEKVASQRANFLHQLSTQMARTHAWIAIEDLHVAGMLANHHLAKGIADDAWGEFFRQLDYKCRWYGCELVQIGRFEASSKTCSVCGWVKADLTLAEREWDCEGCGAHLDRDLNAAVNMLKFSRGRVIPRTYACEELPVAESLKQEWIWVEPLAVQS